MSDKVASALAQLRAFEHKTVEEFIQILDSDLPIEKDAVFCGILQLAVKIFHPHLQDLPARLGVTPRTITVWTDGYVPQQPEVRAIVIKNIKDILNESLEERPDSDEIPERFTTIICGTWQPDPSGESGAVVHFPSTE